MSLASKGLQFILTPPILMQGGSISSTIHVNIPGLRDSIVKIMCQKASGCTCGHGAGNTFLWDSSRGAEVMAPFKITLTTERVICPITRVIL